MRRWNRIKNCAFAQEIVALAIAALASEAHMHRILFAVALGIWTGGALAQTGGAPSAGSQSSPGTAAPGPARANTPATAVPGAATAPPAPSAPLNSQTAPPSRSLPSTAPSATSPTPSGAAGTTHPAGTASPGAPAAPDPNLPATASGGATGSAQRTGKNPITEHYTDCVKLWDNQTHMSKAEWSRTCRRIANRLQNLRVENMDVDVSGPKPRRTGKSPGSS